MDSYSLHDLSRRCDNHIPPCRAGGTALSATLRLVVLGCALLVVSGAALAANKYYTLGDIVIGEVWAAETPGDTKTGAVYFKLANGGTEGDYLISASTPIAAKAELHAHRIVGNTMQMRPIMGIALGAKQKYTLKPGGTHVMLMGLKRPLNDGDSFPMTLMFKSAGSVQISVRVGLPSGVSGSTRKPKGLESYRRQ